MARQEEIVGIQRSRIRRIVNEVSELPGISLVAEPWYRRRFRAHRRGNAYFGVYADFAAALADIPPGLPPGYDTEAAADLYQHRLSQIEASDYPALFWLQRFLDSGERRIFDLGGHVGLSYYAFGAHLNFPDNLRWQVHDVPVVMEKGRALALERDPRRKLEFVGLDEVDGCDVLMAKGALQYLDYTLPELLRKQAVPPRNLLINLTPMHPTRSFFTLQHIGIAVCPYRIGALSDFLVDIRALGYRLIERWEHLDRSVRIPFHPHSSIDRYHGFCFSRE
jgi:putative methyltransferase (TIGR04325 family)